MKGKLNYEFKQYKSKFKQLNISGSPPYFNQI